MRNTLRRWVYKLTPIALLIAFAEAAGAPKRW